MTARFTRLSVRMQRLAPCAQRGLATGLAALGLAGALALSALAQTPAISPAALPGASAQSAKPVVVASLGGPGWTELSAVERDILKPLASSWSALSPGHKSKWRQMAKSYPSLPTEEQVKMQGRMKEWVALSPQQRNQARLNFATTKELSKELTPDEKKAKWQAYQALSEEEKRKLAAKAPPKPMGAAATAKPVAPQKLATVPLPADKPKAKPTPKIADAQATPGTSAPATAPETTPTRSP